MCGAEGGVECVRGDGLAPAPGGGGAAHGMCEGEGGSEPAVRSSIPLALHLTPRASPYGKRKSDMVLREQAPGNHI